MSSMKRSRSRAFGTNEESKSILLPVTKANLDFNQGVAIKDLRKEVNRLKKLDTSINHFKDSAVVSTIGNTATVYALTDIAQGDSEQDRSGDKVGLKFLRLSLTFVPNASALNDSARVIVFRWKGSLSGTAPATVAILKSVTNINSPLHEDYRDQMVVLYDRKHAVSNSQGNKEVILNKGLGKVTATYIGGGAGAYNGNNIFMLLLCTDSVNPASIAWYSRVTFTP